MQQLQIPMGSININNSLQIGDHIYYSPQNPVIDSGGFDTGFNESGSVIYQLGVLINITTSSGVQLVVIYDENVIGAGVGFPPLPVTGDFIMFKKDKQVNSSSLLGYYANTTIRNSSVDKAELFNISADYFESSK